MKTMTPQEVFDTAVRGVLGQGRPAIRVREGGTVCVFRGADGAKCANGWLIPDELWDERFDGLTMEAVTQLLVDRGLDLTEHLRFTGAYEDRLLARLQSAHDMAAFSGRTLKTGNAFIEAFKAYAQNVAADFNLNPDVLAEEHA
jgi:hypothetical protein